MTEIKVINTKDGFVSTLTILDQRKKGDKTTWIARVEEFPQQKKGDVTD